MKARLLDSLGCQMAYPIRRRLSSGVAYTLQIVGQKYTEPTTATLIMSLEAVFAVLAGWLILGEVMSAKEIVGCILVFMAVILAQIPLPSHLFGKS